MRPEELDQWLECLYRGDRRALAKLISWVEDGIARDYIMRCAAPRSGSCLITGFTGAPGVGKSSLVDTITGIYRAKEKRVGIVAVDPSSPLSGGAILGDRIRMQSHGTDRGVFIRSMGSRGYLGGLSRSALDVLQLMEVAGFHELLLETVGVGQSEIDIMQLADTVVVILNPGSGDGIQAIKAGIMEVADIFVVNKADLPGAQRLKNEIEMMLGLSADGKAWRPPVVLTSTVTNQGLTDLVNHIDSHRSFLIKSGEREEQRQQRLKQAVWRQVEDKAWNLFEEVWTQNLAKRQHKGSDFYILAEEAWRAMMEGGSKDE